MATSLKSVGNQAPGFYGLNLEDSSTTQTPQWATEANNCIITSDGRVGCRKGYTIKDTLGSSGTIRTMHEYIDASGNSDIIACVGNSIYKANSPYTSFSSIYSTSITADNWQIVNFNDKTYFFQAAHSPLVYNGTTVSLLSAESGYADSADSVIGTEKPDIVFAGFGRLWVGKGRKIWWSDSLSGHVWNSGSAGSLDLDSVLDNDGDYVVAISSFQSYLVIFLRRSIIVYTGAGVVPGSNMAMKEYIRSVGCIARDSVQVIGDDILFLSDIGVRALSRILIEGNSPIKDVTKNIRKFLSLYLFGETPANIKSLYNAKEGFYLLSLPTYNKVICIDVRAPLPDNTGRITTWDTLVPSAMVSLTNQEIYFGKAYYVCEYTSYTDDSHPIIWSYATPWLDYDAPYNLKILKDFFVLAESGANSTVSICWATDYKETYSCVQRASAATAIAEYNVAEYNIGEYGYGYAISTLAGPMSKAGKTIKIRMSASVTNQFNLKKYEIYAKMGRTA